jgi:DnaJ-class molecular chaperone
MTSPDPQAPHPGDEAPPGASQTGENTCRHCAGRGKLDDGQTCPECGGTGRIIETVGDA